MSTVEEIVDAIKALSPQKRDEVRRQLEVLSISTSPESLGQLEGVDDSYRMDRRYRESPNVNKRRPSRKPPIHIKGKPVSETVVEERR